MENRSDFPFICGTLQLRCRVAHPLTVPSTTSPLVPLRKLGVARSLSSSSTDPGARATLMQGRMISPLSRPISWPISKRITRFVVNVLKKVGYKSHHPGKARVSLISPLQHYSSLSYIIAHIYRLSFVPISVAFIVFCFVILLVPATNCIYKIDG